MDVREAALKVLAEAGEDLHWTVVWDRALRSGYVDAFTQAGARDEMIRELAAMAREGAIERTSKGTYRIAGA